MTASVPGLRLRRYNPRARPPLRLVCFPYAGGGVSVFHAWPAFLPAAVEVCSPELPGRDTLIGQPPLTRLPALVEYVRSALEPLLDRPFVLFGHSMGALVAFELTRALRRERAPLPRALWVSGHRAPQLADPRAPLHALPDAEFVAELHRLQGTPPQVLQNRELMELFLPLLRADFTLCETYEYAPEAPLEIPILAWGGLQDAEVSPAEVAAWERQTGAEFRLRMLPGTHFFLHSAAHLLLRALDRELGGMLARLPPLPAPGG